MILVYLQIMIESCVRCEIILNKSQSNCEAKTSIFILQKEVDLCYNDPVNRKKSLFYAVGSFGIDPTAWYMEVIRMKIKKLGALVLAGVLMCTAPTASVMASDASEVVQELISDNEIGSLVSDPDKVVDIIVYAKDQVAQQDISDDQIREVIKTAESTFGVSLTEEEENKLVNIVKEVKNANIDEQQLRSTVNKVYDKLEEMGIGKEEVKGIFKKLIEFAKSLLD